MTAQDLGVLKTIEMLMQINGTNGKIDFLNFNKENKLLLRILFFVYSPSVTSNIGEKKLKKEISRVPMDENFFNKHTENLFSFLDFLQFNSTGKDADIMLAQAFINEFPKHYQEILFDIVTQKLSIGMDIKNINKACGFKMINKIDCMLAYPYEKRIDKIKPDTVFAITEKLDGNRFIVDVNDCGVKTAYSRNGLVMQGYEDFLNALQLSNGFVYDGELLPSSTDGLNSKEQYKAISTITRTSTSDKDKSKIKYHIFDVIPREEFFDGKSKNIYTDRRHFLNSHPNTDYQEIVEILGYYSINDKGLKDLLKEVVAQGKEGLMGNTLGGLYEGKRSGEILKFKIFHDCDIKCTGVFEGTGKFKGTLGGILCDYKGFELRVGTGFSDAERKYYWENPQAVVGKIVKINYFEETKNDKGGISLRFPTVDSGAFIREDKNEESYN